MSKYHKCGCQIMDPFRGNTLIHDVEKCVVFSSKEEVIHIHPVYPEHCGAIGGIQHTNKKDITCPLCLENMA